MATLAEASLDQLERRVVRDAVASLRERLGEDLISVWLYGSRARGEQPGRDSDVDLLIVTREGRSDLQRVTEVVWDAAGSAGANPFSFSTKVYDPAYLSQRREIESFFIQEVDRDKVVLHGEP